MSYDKSGFNCISNFIGAIDGTPIKKFGYVTNDNAATVAASGYFNDEADKLNVGDQIDVCGDLDGTPFRTDYVVASNDGSTVTIS